MTDDDIKAMDNPKNYKKRKTILDDYLNIIYKMLLDNIAPEIIISYVLLKGYTGKIGTLAGYIAKVIFNNNFGAYRKIQVYDYQHPKDITIISRNKIFKYITTKDLKKKKNRLVERNIEIIKLKYPIVQDLQAAYDEFYEIIMGEDESLLDGFMDNYEESTLASFVNGLKKDIVSVKNAVSYDESSGFVEGNNNKFKLIKRTLYGRAGLKTLFAKSYFAFKINDPNFNILQITQKAIRR